MNKMVQRRYLKARGNKLKKNTGLFAWRKNKPASLEGMSEIDRQIVELQRGTKTTFRAFNRIHNLLRSKYGFYYKWHTYKKREVVHSGALITTILLISSIIFNTFYTPLARASDYSKTWSSTADFDTATNSNLSTAGDQLKLASTSTSTTENFVTTTYKDAANTSATWDTAARKVVLPGTATVGGLSTNLQDSWKSAVGAVEGIKSLVCDSTNNYIYIGGYAGSFVAYSPATFTAVNLTSKISATWATTSVAALTFDSTNGKIYLGSGPGKFGVFTGGTDPANGTFVSLAAKISAEWSASYIYGLAFDSVNGKVYLGGDPGKFGAFTGGADPANGTYVSLTAKISATWSTSPINALVFDSTNGKVYLGGNSGKFGAFTGGADPANGTYASLIAKLAATWSTNAIYALTFDLTNGKVYVGGANGNFGSFTGGADPANGAWVFLTSKISATWSSDFVWSLGFDSANGKVYIGGSSGKFGAFSGGSDPSSGSFVSLTAKISNDINSSYAVGAMAFNSTNGKIYLAGRLSSNGGDCKFGSYAGNSDPTNGTWSFLTSSVASKFPGYAVYATVVDTTNNTLYIGGEGGRLVAYNLLTGVTVDLTSKLFANGTIYNILALAYDSTNNKIYLGGQYATFGVFTGGADPANGSYVNLNPKIYSDWATSNINALAFDSVNSKIYLGGAGSFGVFTGGADPANNGTYVSLYAKITTDFAGNTINALSFDFSNNKLYIGGDSGKFGVFTGGADPANGTWVYLTAKISANWSTNIIYALAFDSVNGKVYLGGGGGRFGAYAGGADPANGTWTYLVTKITANWSTSIIYALAFDSANGRVYMGGATGKFGYYLGGSVPANGTWTYLNSSISSFWSGDIRTVVYAACCASAFIGGLLGQFASYALGYVSDKNGISLAIDNTARPIASATLTATETKPANTGITYYLSNDAGVTWNTVTSSTLYNFTAAGSDLRWKANLTSSTGAATPELTNVAITYSYYNSSTGSSNMTFDSANAASGWLAMTWNATKPTNTTLTSKIRSASSLANLASATWSAVQSTTPVNLRTVTVGAGAGLLDNQFIEVEADLASSDGMNTPTLSDITTTYSINTAPVLQNLTSAYSTSGNKILSIGYQLKDTDTATNPYNSNKVSMSYQYSTNGGSTWSNFTDSAISGDKGLVSVSGSSFGNYLATVDLSVDLPDTYNTQFQVKATANDNEQVHSTASATTASQTVDTKKPVVGATPITINAGAALSASRDITITLSATDSSDIEVAVSEDQNALTTWSAYTPSKSFQLSALDGTKTVYVKYRDIYGNTESTVSSDTIGFDLTAPVMTTLSTAKSALVAGTNITSGNWYNYAAPSFTWARPDDSALSGGGIGSGIAGYLTYFGTDDTVNISQTNGVTTPGVSNGAFVWQASTGATETYTSTTSLGNGDMHYLKIIPVDTAGNVDYHSYNEGDATTAYDLFSYKYDNVMPLTVDHVSVAQAGCSNAAGFDFSWSASSDATSGLRYYEYKVGVMGTVYNTTATAVSGVVPARDNENVFYVRPVDNAGNTNPVDPTQSVWQSVVFCSTQVAHVTSGPDYTRTLSSISVTFETSVITTGKLEVYADDGTTLIGNKVVDTTTYLHNLTVDKLQPNTPYKYKVIFKDQYGNEGTTSLYPVTTDLVSLSHATYLLADSDISKVEVSYETSKPTKGKVEVYNNVTLSKVGENSESAFTLNHTLSLGGLASGNSYSYSISYTDEESNSYSYSGYTFDTTGLRLAAEPTVTSATADLSKATLAFDTNLETTARTEFYDSALAKIAEASDSDFSVSHSLDISGLKSNTAYSYTIWYTDKSGNSGTFSSQQYFIVGSVGMDIEPGVSLFAGNLSKIIVTFRTASTTTARVEFYDEQNAKVAETTDTDQTKDHDVVINGLKSGQKYTYKVFYTDQTNQSYEFGPKIFATETVGIPTDPAIVSGPSSLKVTWKTTRAATGQVQIKDGDTYREPQGHVDFRTDHEVNILGLKSGKAYKVRILWEDETGVKQTSKEYDSTTAESPSIKNPKVEILLPTSVLVSWQTNYPAVSSLSYPVNGATQTVLIDGTASTFSKKIENLVAGASYQIKILSTTTDGAEFTSIVSAEMPPLPAIASLRQEPIIDSAKTSYKFTWSTNIATSSAIYYKTKDSLAYKTKSSPEMLTAHEIIVDEMEDQATYDYYASGRDQYGNEAKSDLNIITTPNDSRPPKITNFATEIRSSGSGDAQKSSIILTWETDEPASSQVEYSQGISSEQYSFTTKEDVASSTSHAVIVSDLDTSKIYHMRAISKDKAGNAGRSEDTTLITGKIQDSITNIILNSLQRSLGWIFSVFK